MSRIIAGRTTRIKKKPVTMKNADTVLILHLAWLMVCPMQTFKSLYFIAYSVMVSAARVNWLSSGFYTWDNHPTA